MPGPEKAFVVRLKVGLTVEQARALKLTARLDNRTQADVLRRALDKYLSSVKSLKTRQKKADVRLSLTGKWKEDIRLVWDSYSASREKWYQHFRGQSAPGSISLTQKTKDLILASLEEYGKEMTLMSGKGLWLSEYHTDNGFTAPKYAWRLTNVPKFSQLVVEARVGWESQETK